MSPPRYGTIICKGVGALVSTIVFGIFSFGAITALNKLEPAQDCFAHPDYDYAVPANLIPGTQYDGWTNVTPRFMALMQMAFWANLISLVVICPAQAFYVKQYKDRTMNGAFQTADQRDNEAVFPGWLRAVDGIVGISQLIWMLLVLIFRGLHTGRVCAGDYLFDAEKTAPTLIAPALSYYDLGTGTVSGFVMVMIIIALCVLPVVALGFFAY